MRLQEYLLAAAPAAFPSWYASLRAELFGGVHRQWVDALRSSDATRILDWGTGCGELVLALSGRGPATVEGVDESDHLLLHAEELAARRGLVGGRLFHLLDATASPCPGPYERITCAGLRHGTEGLLRTLARCHRRLAPGGELWWADLRADARALPDLYALLRAGRRRPAAIPGFAWDAVWRGAMSRLPGGSEVDDAVRESAFGTALETGTCDVELEGETFPGVIQTRRLRREEVALVS